jgi:hypothetical protein
MLLLAQLLRNHRLELREFYRRSVVSDSERSKPKRAFGSQNPCKSLRGWLAVERGFRV